MEITPLSRSPRPVVARSALCALIWAIASLPIALQASPAHAAERRVALVIGNSHYDDGVPALAIPANDADDIAEALRAMNFEVTALKDLSVRDFRRALQQFSRDAASARAALIFYAGHAMHLEDENYLMPVGARIENKADVKYETVSVEDDIIRRTLADVPVKILILDACRDNPIAKQIAMADRSRSVGDVRGHAPIVQQTSGMLIAYATSANQVAEDGQGRNNPFTKALKNHIREPGVDIQTMLAEVSADVRQDTNDRQRPEISDALPRGFFLSPGDSDTTIWDGIKTTKNIDQLRDFVKRFPNSQFAGEASAKVETLQLQEQYEQFKREAAQRAEATRRRAEDANAALEVSKRAHADAQAKRLTAQQDAARSTKTDRNAVAETMPQNVISLPVGETDSGRATTARKSEVSQEISSQELAQAEARAKDAEARMLAADARARSAQAEVEAARSERVRTDTLNRQAKAEAEAREAVLEACARKAEQQARAAELQAANSMPLPIPDQGRRVALVIGNSAYQAVPMLSNPRGDAEALAETLRKVGFTDVMLAEDVSLTAMKRALLEFQEKADGADWAMVYYAGHGIEIGGQNYLIPVDARLQSDRDADDETVSMSYILARISNAKALRLVILDACRENPFLGSMRRQISSRGLARGLAPIEPHFANELVFYAAKDGEQASDGDVGGHSPFAAALIQRLAMPQIEINKIFRLVTSDVLRATGNRQQPFVYGSTPGEQEFYFRTKQLKIFYTAVRTILLGSVSA